MAVAFISCLQIFPSSDLVKTTDFYEGIGFRAVKYLDSKQPHVCLYRDNIEIILTKSKNRKMVPNREIHGYGYDAYFITDDPGKIQSELKQKGIKIVKELSKTDYGNNEFVFEDHEGRWIGVGKKQTD